MRKLMAAFAVLAFAALLTAPASAATETVTGKVIDQSCYKADKSNTGVDHKMASGEVKDCAIACAKKGRPLALLTTDGKVYTIAGELAANNNEKLIGHVSHTVAITGDVMAKDGAMSISSGALKMVSR
jgi:hypothetical protein